jgi:hypothetical protein
VCPWFDSWRYHKKVNLKISSGFFYAKKCE